MAHKIAPLTMTFRDLQVRSARSRIASLLNASFHTVM